MKYLITGATGFVGKKLVQALLNQEHDVSVVTRNIESAQKSLPGVKRFFEWNYVIEDFPHKALDHAEVIIHLMGENIANKRWSEAQKKKIFESRVLTSQKISDAINANEGKVKTFISTSAIGYYEVNLEDELTEESNHGEGFLSHVCQNWEREVLRAEGVRHAIFRFGVLLGKDGGALKKLLPIFKLGAGGPIGSGNAYMSWIHVNDVVKALIDASTSDQYQGVMNLVSPKTCKNKEFTRALASALHRPAIFPVPEFVLKTVYGEMSSIMVDSQIVKPKKLESIGHQFLFENIDDALIDIVK